jgi:hypothetical protein
MAASVQEKISRARDAGYSNDEIVQFLGQTPDFGPKLKTAIDAGYKSDEILGHLSQPAKTSEGIPQTRFDFQSFKEKLTPEERKSLSRKKLAEGPQWMGLVPQVALSVATPFAAAAGLRGVASLAPSTAKFLAPAATAIETGGFAKTGLGSKAADYAVRVAGGATAGALGTVPISQDQGDILTGAGIGAILPGLGIPLYKAFDVTRNAFSPAVRSRNILAQAAGPEIAQIRSAAAAAPEELTAAQAIAGTESPQLQAIAKQMQERSALRLTGPKLEAQQAANENVLNRLAGGATEAESIGRTKEMSTALRGQTIPILNQSLSDANTITKTLTELEALAPKLSKQAAQEVENVKRLVKAGDIAQASAKLTAIKKGMPSWDALYTYPAKLGRKADEWATQAAGKSLELGAEASQAAGTAQAMRAAGIEPLTADSLTNKIRSVLTVEQTGNSTLSAGVNKVIDDINKASSATGVVDARALYAIRKNSVGEFIKKLFPGAMDSAQKAEAARIMAEINPLIDDAIEKSGGKGFKDYLKTYSEGQRAIEKTEMSAYLRDLYKKDPKAFVDVVSGNNVKAVQDIFGATKFDINTEMGQSLMNQLRPIADDVMRTERMGRLAKEGAPYAGEIVQRNQPSLRVPGMLPKATAANAVLETMQSRLPAKTLDALEKALASGKSLSEVLAVPMPPKERAVLRTLLMQLPKAPAVVNSLSGENRNNLNQ